MQFYRGGSNFTLPTSTKAIDDNNFVYLESNWDLLDQP
jgi:hypothetical protein